MDRYLQSASLTTDEMKASVDTQEEEMVGVDDEPHVHLPNPSLWPLILSAAVLLAVIGLLFIPDSPWLTIVGVILIIVSAMGWALQDPMATRKVEYIKSPEIVGPLARYKIGQEVVDNNGLWLGRVQARFSRYMLVDRGGLSLRVYYVPPRFIEDEVKNNTIHLSVSENELLKRGLDHVPTDLYDESPDLGVPNVAGVPQFARDPLSPAETGHYNYGPVFPGINTDAAGSYRPNEVRPQPQRYVGDRRSLYVNRKSNPPRPQAPLTVEAESAKVE